MPSARGRGVTVDARHDPRLDRRSGTPLWAQLRLILKGWIESGTVGPGDRLPSESELCERFAVSRPVVREALGQLVADGQIYKIKGKGAFVARPKREVEFVGTTIGFWGEMASKGRRVETRVLSQQLDDPTERERAGLHLNEAAKVVRLRRLYIVDGVPTILVTTALPASMVPRLERTSVENRSLYEIIRQSYGLVPHRGERWIEAAVLSREEAELLGVDRRTPVLAIESVAEDERGVPIEYYVAYQRTDDVRLHVVSR